MHMHLGQSEVYKDDCSLVVIWFCLQFISREGGRATSSYSSMSSNTVHVGCLLRCCSDSETRGHHQEPTLPTSRHLGRARNVACCASLNHRSTAPTMLLSPNDKSNCGTQRHYAASNLF